MNTIYNNKTGITELLPFVTNADKLARIAQHEARWMKRPTSIIYTPIDNID